MRDGQHLRKSRQCLLIDAALRGRPAVTQVPLRTVVAQGDQYAARARRRVPEIDTRDLALRLLGHHATAGLEVGRGAAPAEALALVRSIALSSRT